MNPSARDAADPQTERKRLAASFRLGVGLALTPTLAVAVYWAPLRPQPEHLAEALAFAGGALLPVGGLAIAASLAARFSLLLTTFLLAVALWLLTFWLQPPLLSSLVLFDTTLVALAWALGGLLGAKVQHEAHLLPACVVAASADLFSVLTPEGPSHAIVASDRALSSLAVWFPVPGTPAIAPALGVGDLIFVALVFAVARQHRVPYANCVAACLIGTALSGLLSACLAAPVPALVPIAAALVLGIPRIRRLRPQDRAAAGISMILAAALVLVTVLRVRSP